MTQLKIGVIVGGCTQCHSPRIGAFYGERSRALRGNRCAHVDLIGGYGDVGPGSAVTVGDRCSSVVGECATTDIHHQAACACTAVITHGNNTIDGDIIIARREGCISGKGGAFEGKGLIIGKRGGRRGQGHLINARTQTGDSLPTGYGQGFGNNVGCRSTGQSTCGNNFHRTIGIGINTGEGRFIRADKDATCPRGGRCRE